MVGTRQIRFCLAHAKESDDGEAVEDPAREDEEICQFFESARERHQACENPLKNKRSSRGAILRMNAVGNFEENPVAGHGVTDTRAAQHRRIHGAERGNHHRPGDPRGSAESRDPRHDVGGDVER